MDDAKDLLASILKTVRDRFSNPLVSAFAIAWLIWNFRVVLVLIGDGEGGWLAKIDYLDKRLMTPAWMWGVHGVLIPLLVALAWIYLLPPVLRKIATHHETESSKTKAAMLAALEQTPISEEDRQKLWANFANEKRSWDVERSELLKVIAESGTVSRHQPPAPTLETGGTEVAEGSNPSPESSPLPLKREDFFSLVPKDRAAFIGLRLREPTPEDATSDGNVRLTFTGLLIEWPWMPTGNKLPGLQTDICRAINGKIFNSQDLIALYLLRNKTFRGGTLEFNLQATLDLLEYSGLSDSREDGRLQLTTRGRLFLAWLLRVGFLFEELGPTEQLARTSVSQP